MELRLPSTLEFPAHMRLTTHYFRLCLFLCLPSRRPSLGAGFFPFSSSLVRFKSGGRSKKLDPSCAEISAKTFAQRCEGSFFCIVYHDISDTPEFLSQHISVLGRQTKEVNSNPPQASDLCIYPKVTCGTINHRTISFILMGFKNPFFTLCRI